MSKGAVNFAKNDDYYTPKYIVDLFGKFDYDPATTAKRANILNIPNYDTIETNGLTSDWSKYQRIWINPPFSQKHLFLEKAVEVYQKTKAEIYFLCPIEFLTTKRFHKILWGGVIYLPNGRIKFENQNGLARSPAFGSVIIKIDNKFSIKLLNIDKEKIK